MKLEDRENNHNEERVLLGLKLKQIREERGLTIEELAERIGIRPSTIAGTEIGRFWLSTNVLNRLALALDCHIDIVPNED